MGIRKTTIKPLSPENLQCAKYVVPAKIFNLFFVCFYQIIIIIIDMVLKNILLCKEHNDIYNTVIT